MRKFIQSVEKNSKHFKCPLGMTYRSQIREKWLTAQSQYRQDDCL